MLAVSGASRVSADKSPSASRRIKRLLAPIALGVLRWSSFKAGIVLCYHGLAEEDGDPTREIVPSHGRETFESHLELLARRHHVVPAAEILDAISRRGRGEPFPIAITFDDDRRSHTIIAAPALAARRLPATFFLSGASLENPVVFWWERLQRVLDEGLALPERISGAGSPLALAELVRTMSPDERLALCNDLEVATRGAARDSHMRREDVTELARQGFEIGFHTLRHDTLTALDDEDLRSALADGRKELERVVRRPVRLVAYPFGAADRRVAAAAEAAGYELGFALGGVTPSTPHRHLVPRVAVRIESAEELELTISGTLVNARRRAHRHG